jgi:YidC/Oxa1 family membrane protein insertase
MKNIFNTIIFNPLLGTLEFLYQHFHDIGLAIIILTIIVRFILLPFFYKGAKDQAIMQRLAPKIKEIQKTHKDNLSNQTQELMKLYKEHRVNPMSSMLLLLVQLPILIALYRVITQGLKNITVNHFFLNFIDLSKPNLLIIVLATVAAFYQGVLSLPKVDKSKVLSPTDKMTRQMALMSPMFTVIILLFLPSALGLYILVGTLFSVVQQLFINKSLKNI